MNFKLRSVCGLFFGLYGSLAMAYGNSSSGHHCDKPRFSSFQPAPNKYTQSFNEFSFEASANTVPTSIVVTVSVNGKQRQWKANELEIDELRSGRLEVTGKIRPALEGGFARVSIVAHSKPGCEEHDGFLVRVH